MEALTLPSFQPAWKVGSSFDAEAQDDCRRPDASNPASRDGRGFYGEAIRGRSAPTLTEPASSNQSRALIKSTLNCLCDSSNSGLEELLRERPERLAEPNAPPQGASVKERELSRL